MAELANIIEFEHRRGDIRLRLSIRPTRRRSPVPFLPLNAQVMLEKMKAAHQAEMVTAVSANQSNPNATETLVADHYSLNCV